jgi:CheY-like chemotaxis protein
MDSLSRIQQNPSECVYFPLNRVVEDAVHQLVPVLDARAQREEARVSLKTYLRASSSIKGMPDDVLEAIKSIVLNAVEAMPGGGDVYLTTEEDGSFAHIHIQDSGEGIHDRIRDKIFDPFFTTKDKGGLGLSLSYVVVKRHGGDLEVTSRRDGGTIVSIILPVAKTPRRAKRAKVRGKIKNARFLLIEDEDIVRQLLSQLLESKGHKVEVAVSGLEGLSLLERKGFDCVIAGVRTIDLERPLLLKRIKKTNRDVPLALIAEHEEVEGPWVESSVDLIIRKPIDMNRVMKQIMRVLVKRGRGS